MKPGKYVAQAGVIAAIYGMLTLVVIQNPWGFGPVQLRLSEVCTVLALFTPAAIPGLWLGAVLANTFMVFSIGPIALLDVAFGGLGSLLGAAWTWRHRDRIGVALAGPVVVNALIVPAYLPVMLAGLGFYRVPLFGLDVEGSWVGMYLFGVAAVGLGQALVIYGLGLPVAQALRSRLGPLADGGPSHDDA